MQLFKEYFICCSDIVPAKTTQRKMALFQKDKFVLNTAFVGRHGAVVIIFKSSSIFSRNCVLLETVVAFI